ncbi:MAG: hypothetical protein IT159_02955 [Bryobacterales bacterium]|nr:hypothetical protein [Bryobacterales bacterium]
MNDRRAETRIRCFGVVDVSWMDRRGGERRERGSLEDISYSGVCLLMAEPISRGTVIRILHSTGEIHARVRYCRLRDAGYFLGAEFFAGCRGWPELYLAEHLVDLQTLVSRSANRAGERAASAAAGDTGA